MLVAQHLMAAVKEATAAVMTAVPLAVVVVA
jgi:hypothetical protein